MSEQPSNPWGLPDDVFAHLKPVGDGPGPLARGYVPQAATCQASCCNPVFVHSFRMEPEVATYTPGVCDIPLEEWEHMTTTQKFAALG